MGHLGVRGYFSFRSALSWREKEVFLFDFARFVSNSNFRFINREEKKIMRIKDDPFTFFCDSFNGTLEKGVINISDDNFGAVDFFFNFPIMTVSFDGSRLFLPSKGQNTEKSNNEIKHSWREIVRFFTDLLSRFGNYIEYACIDHEYFFETLRINMIKTTTKDVLSEFNNSVPWFLYVNNSLIEKINVKSSKIFQSKKSLRSGKIFLADIAPKGLLENGDSKFHS